MMDWFQDEYNSENNGGWIMVNPRNLEPSIDNPVPNSRISLPGVSPDEAAAAREDDPVVDESSVEEMTKMKKLDTPMYMRDPEEEGLTLSEKRQILKAAYSRSFRVKQINQSKGMQDENEDLKKHFVLAKDKMNRWMQVLIEKYILVEKMKAKDSASNEFKATQAI